MTLSNNCYGSYTTPWWKNSTTQKDTSDAPPLLGADMDLRNDEFEWQSNEIAELVMENKTWRDHFCRIKLRGKFWKETYSECYGVGVIKVSNSDLKNPTKF